jgi:hypothetical protein
MRDSDLDGIRRWANLLDNAFQIPGTRIRFGFDAIIGLIPGVGDLSAPVFAAVILVTGFKLRLPAIVQARMVLNAVIDMALGLVPVLGDLADIAWKANLMNLALLERHARPGVPPSQSDYVFVIVCVIVLAFVAIAPLMLLAYVLSLAAGVADGPEPGGAAASCAPRRASTTPGPRPTSKLSN